MSNELHTMPLKLEALFSSLKFRTMTWDEKGAYLLILSEAWLKGGLIEAQADTLKGCLNGISDEDLARVKRNVIDRCFVEDDQGNWYNPRQIEIYKDIQKRVLKLSEAGRKGGLSQAQGRLKQPKPKPKPNTQSVGARENKIEFLKKFDECLGDCADLMLTWWEQQEEVNGIDQRAVKMNIERWSRFGTFKRQSLENSISGAKNQLYDPRTKPGEPPKPEPPKLVKRGGGYL